MSPIWKELRRLEGGRNGNWFSIKELILAGENTAYVSSYLDAEQLRRIEQYYPLA